MFSFNRGVASFAVAIPQFLSITKRGTLVEITSVLTLILGNNGKFYALEEFYINLFSSLVSIFKLAITST